MTGTPIDAAAFKHLQDTTDAEFAAELVDAFLADAPALLQVLRSAQVAGDAVAFRRAAHSLKSNGNSFGAFEFAAQARALEETPMEALGDSVHDRLEQLDQAYACAAAALQALCHG